MPIDTDPYAGQSAGVLTLGQDGETITPSDGTDLSTFYRYIQCGETGGVIKYYGRRGALGPTFSVPLAAGAVLQFRPTRILSTGTTATPLYGIF